MVEHGEPGHRCASILSCGAAFTNDPAPPLPLPAGSTPKEILTREFTTALEILPARTPNSHEKGSSAWYRHEEAELARQHAAKLPPVPEGGWLPGVSSQLEIPDAQGPSAAKD